MCSIGRGPSNDPGGAVEPQRALTDVDAGVIVSLLEDLVFVQTHVTNSITGLNSVLLELRFSARTLAETLGRVVADVCGADASERTVRDQLVETRSAARELSSAAGRQLSDQERLAENAASLVDRISTGAKRTENVVKLVGILSMNTRIEAFRLGASGRAVKVLAEAVSEVEKEVQGVNSTIADLTRQLNAALPKIARGSSEVAANLTSNLKGVDAAILRIVERQDEIISGIGRSAGDGSQHATGIERALGEAIVQTQFSDRVCQVVERTKWRLVDILERVDRHSAADWRLRLGAVSESTSLANPNANQLESGEINFL